MTKKQILQKIIKEKIEKDKNYSVNWENRKNKWLKSIDKLYKNIEKWLTPLINKKLILIDFKEIDIAEEYIGYYRTKELILKIKNYSIRFRPKASLIVGAYGRIDISSLKGDKMLIMEKWDIWKLIDKYPQLQEKEFNEDTFIEIIQELI